MPSASKNKGSGFEREVAKFLTELYGETFIRAPGSGAYTGGSNSHRKQLLHEGQVRTFKGDIVPGQSFQYFNAEAKFYADFSFHQLFTESRQLNEWIEQLITASDPNDLNVLFMKFNRRGRYVAVQAKLHWDSDCSYFLYRSSRHGDWMIYSFEKFFELNSEIFRQYSEKSILCEHNNSNTDTVLNGVMT